jgi:hypothetical protein
LKPILGVDPFDGHHRHQHLDLRYLGRVAREQRLDVVRPRRRHHEVDPVARDVDARELVHDAVDLDDHDPVLERGGLDDGRRVLGVGAGVEVAVPVRRLGRHQRHARGQVDEVAAEQLEVSMDGADVELSGRRQFRHARRLRPGERKIELRRDASLEHVEVFRQRQYRLQHVQPVDACRVEPGQRLRQEVCLLLVVPFEADAVATLQHGVQQVGDARGRHRLAVQRIAERGRRAAQALVAVGL